MLMVKMAYTEASRDYLMGIGLYTEGSIHLPCTIMATARLDGYDNHNILDIHFSNTLNIYSTNEYCWIQFENKYPLTYLVKP